MPRVIHFEISAKNPEKTVDFYKKVFGWSISKWEGPIEYWLIKTGDPDQPGIDGAISRNKDENTVTNTIGVSSIDEYIEKIRANGGEIVVPKNTIKGVGHLAYFKDPEGNIHGIMQEDPLA